MILVKEKVLCLLVRGFHWLCLAFVMEAIVTFQLLVMTAAAHLKSPLMEWACTVPMQEAFWHRMLCVLPWLNSTLQLAMTTAQTREFLKRHGRLLSTLHTCKMPWQMGWGPRGQKLLTSTMSCSLRSHLLIKKEPMTLVLLQWTSEERQSDQSMDMKESRA